MRAYQVEITYDSLFPLLMVYRAAKTEKTERPNHLHDWYEFVFVHEGTGVFFIDQTFYEIKPGDLYVIPGNTIHRATPSSTLPYTVTAVYFSPSILYRQRLGDSMDLLDPFKQCKDSGIYNFTFNEREQEVMVGWLENIHNELTAQQTGYRLASLLGLQQILLHLGRLGSRILRQPNRQQEAAGPAWMKEIMAYIDANYLRKLTLEHLAQQALVSPSYFSRVFKQMTGMTLTVYLNNKRFIKAKERLLETDDSIARIAEACGFTSLPNFYRSFKAYCGTTPADYRAKSS